MDIHRKSNVSRSTADILKFVMSCRPLQIGMPLANASQICRIYGYITLPDYVMQ
jgi:hypothetical protein